MNVERIREQAKGAAQAATDLSAMSLASRNTALDAMAAALQAGQSEILSANARDCARSEAEGLSAPLLKRLKLDPAKLEALVHGLHDLMRLPDPLGRTLNATELDTGLHLFRMTCPIGVIGVVFESRPDALVQIAGLCLKSGNAVMLKGGREAVETNRVLAECLVRAGVSAAVPSGWLQLLESREDVVAMLALDEWIDLIIPRGSNEFVRHIMDHTRIPVMGHADGICHVYVDGDADLEMATAIAVDSKCQYTAVCNALETLLVDAAVADQFLPQVARALTQRGVTLRGCARTRERIACDPADESDWQTEYLDRILAIRVVDGLDAAIAHVNRYGSGHTDAIVTRDAVAARRFMQRVDSGNVFWNAGTRFSDGYRYGLGAEVGISTGKLHARGPVGLEGLTTYKWLLRGEGHVVGPYADGERVFTHRPLPPEMERH